MKSEEEVDRRFATTLARGLKVLRAFRPSDDGLGNQEISKRTGIPKSSVSRLTFTLHKLGYLSHSHRHDRYRFGPAALALGNVANASVTFVEAANPLMQELADETGTLAIIAVRDEHKMLLTKTWRPKGGSTIWLDVGTRIPLAQSSSGHAYLASLSDQEFENALQQILPADASVNEELLRRFRREGYQQMINNGFVSPAPEQRYAETINAVSTGFRSNDFGDPVAISCGATSEDLSTAKLFEEVGPKLRDKVRELEKSMGLPPVMVTRG
ncbi:IclR family transcriptional regulator [Flexibacterium corallicola]|uniref:IclR family transcriptional regulator n=1 Tax=Flexibacterium corallicola TaxID=3037259 RepID=UPI00286ED3AC|nr:IclR family transcriptional regulator [Pseudovibrio sp. M1P-2-3]